MSLSSRDRVLKLLGHESIDRVPCFSGMGNVTTEGMKKHGIKFSQVHRSAKDMAALAASSYRLFGYECAVAPFDLGMEAEALGCGMNYYDASQASILYPTIKTKILKFGEELNIPDAVEQRGRVPLIAEAIEILKGDVGGEVAVGSYVLGPFTLAGQIMDLNELLKNSFKKPQEIGKILEALVQPIVSIAKTMREAGADYITVREMGATGDILSPRLFKSLIQPHLIAVLKQIPAPRILHMCGNTNAIIEELNKCGAEALSVDHKCDVAAARQKLGKAAVILGDLDGYNVLVKGSPSDVEKAVEGAIRRGVSGVMPGCDIWPEAPASNMIAMVEATKKYGIIS